MRQQYYKKKRCHVACPCTYVGVTVPSLFLFVLTIAVVVVLVIAHVRSKFHDSTKGVLDNPMYLANTDDNLEAATNNCTSSSVNINIADKSNDTRPKLETPISLSKVETTGERYKSKYHLGNPPPPLLVWFGVEHAVHVEPVNSSLEKSAISDKTESKRWSALCSIERECVVPSMVKLYMLRAQCTIAFMCCANYIIIIFRNKEKDILLLRSSNLKRSAVYSLFYLLTSSA